MSAKDVRFRVQAHRRWGAGRVSQRRRCGALRHRSAKDYGRAQCRRRARSPHRISDRHSCRPRMCRRPHSSRCGSCATGRSRPGRAFRISARASGSSSRRRSPRRSASGRAPCDPLTWGARPRQDRSWLRLSRNRELRAGAVRNHGTDGRARSRCLAKRAQEPRRRCDRMRRATVR